MTGNDLEPGCAAPAGRRPVLPPRIAGIIEGSMTLHPEPGGGVSFRIIVGIGTELTAEHDLLELIISAAHVRDVSRALTGDGQSISGRSDQVLSLPCHIGFCPNAASIAA